jgi:hypothetical protein
MEIGKVYPYREVVAYIVEKPNEYEMYVTGKYAPGFQFINLTEIENGTSLIFILLSSENGGFYKLIEILTKE